MLAPQRQALILEELNNAGAVRVSELVRRLGVSDMTIRRDLDSLASRGLAEKVHGGATRPVVRPSDEPTFVAKSSRQTAEKHAIARRAATLVQPGAAVAISAGTTTSALAQQLTAVPGLTVVTNSLPVAEALMENDSDDRTVVLTGGECTPSRALVGTVTVAALHSLHVDLVFMGVHGLDAQAGLTTPNMLEAETNRAMIAAGGRLVVVADHTKWGTIGLSRFARIDDVDVVVSDAALPDDAREHLSQRTELVLAG
ncbi:DeoR/GlpR family DNA-binding transcription regulator [Motilibacter peucedani]|uniref:DeoR/GlpR family DNA-binding transcription regulator n=1 Tax=Motilibacter peucedani TaxID=598650 RepID=UPI000EB0E87A